MKNRGWWYAGAGMNLRSKHHYFIDCEIRLQRICITERIGASERSTLPPRSIYTVALRRWKHSDKKKALSQEIRANWRLGEISFHYRGIYIYLHNQCVSVSVPILRNHISFESISITCALVLSKRLRHLKIFRDNYMYSIINAKTSASY